MSNQRGNQKLPRCGSHPDAPCAMPSPSTMSIAGDYYLLNPYEAMRQRNCKPAAFSLGERYPSIRPPVSRCSHSQSLDWLDKSLEQDGCFDPECRNDALKIWQRSPQEQALSYYGVGNPLKRPQVGHFNKAVKSSLKFASMASKRVLRPKHTRPPLSPPMKPPQPAPVCKPYILNVQALQAELQRMPTVKQKLRPNEAFSALYCKTPIDPKDPLGVNEARTKKAREMGKALDKQKSPKQEPRSKYWNCPPKCDEAENKCTDYEWAKYKLDSRSHDKAFQREFMEQAVVQPDREPLNYEELYHRFEACFEVMSEADPECKAMVKCCPELYMPGGTGGAAGDGAGGANGGDGADGDKDQDGDNDKDKDKDRFKIDRNKHKDRNRDKDREKGEDIDNDKDMDKDKDKDKDRDEDKDKDQHKDKDKNKDKDKGKDKDKDNGKDRDKDKDKNKDKEGRNKNRKKEQDGHLGAPDTRPKMPKDYRLTDASETPIPKAPTEGLNRPEEPLIPSTYRKKPKQQPKKPRRKKKKKKKKVHVSDKDQDKDKNRCPPCGCDPCCICNVLYEKPVEDKPFMKALMREQKESEARNYLRLMRRREYLNCDPTYKAPPHRVDPITCDDAIYRVPKVTECCDCLGALQRLQRLLNKRPYSVGKDEVNFLLADLRSRLSRRLCEAIEA